MSADVNPEIQVVPVIEEDAVDEVQEEQVHFTDENQVAQIHSYLLEVAPVPEDIGPSVADYAIALIKELSEAHDGHVEELASLYASIDRNERYEAIGRKAEEYIKREQSARLAWQSDEARALKRELTALIEG